MDATLPILLGVLRARPIVAALAVAPEDPRSPDCDRRRELTFVTGLPAAAHRFRADRPAGASREVEGLFPSAFTGRAVPTGGDQPPDHPAAALAHDPHTRVGSGLAHAVFRASRLRWRSLCLLETPSVRVIRGCILLGLRTGLASDHSRDLAAARSWAAGNAPGIRLRPSQFCSTPAGDGAFFRQRLEPTCRFARGPPRVSSIAGLAEFFGEPRDIGPRLLGFGPAEWPCRAIRRSR